MPRSPSSHPNWQTHAAARRIRNLPPSTNARSHARTHVRKSLARMNTHRERESPCAYTYLAKHVPSYSVSCTSPRGDVRRMQECARVYIQVCECVHTYVRTRALYTCTRERAHGTRCAHMRVFWQFARAPKMHALLLSHKITP